MKEWIINNTKKSYLAIGWIVFFLQTLFLFVIMEFGGPVGPSSTAGLAYPIFIVIAGSVGIIGALFGIIAGVLFQSILSLIVKDSRKIIITAVILIGTLIPLSDITVAYLFGGIIQETKKYNEKNTEGIKFDAGIIEKVNTSGNILKNYNLDLNWNHAIGYMGGKDLEKQKDFNWNGKKYVIVMDDIATDNPDIHHFLIKNGDGSVFIDKRLDGYNYIKGISYISYPIESNVSYLFVLVRLRATSFQSVLTVFSNSGELVYEELTDASDILEIGEIDNGEKIIVVANRQSVVWKSEPDITIKKYFYKIKK